MKKIIFLILAILCFKSDLYPKLLINELVCGSSNDWVELFLQSSEKEKLDISKLYVTMYYGTNEQLGIEPITIYSYDRPETPYDDRFVIVHLTDPNSGDETDMTGDINKNGYIDVYCNNYYGSLWNTDGVVSIDTDDDPSNGGILDFIAYSNIDGSPNKTITSYINYAYSYGQWLIYASGNIQESTINIGLQGLKPYMSISRKNNEDTNSYNDFSVTSTQTPGKPNIFLPDLIGKKIFRPLKKTVTIVPTNKLLGKGEIPLFIYQNCNIKFYIFSINGMVLHKSILFKTIAPGFYSLYWDSFIRKPNLPTGLYICKIEAISTSLRISETKFIYIILSRYNGTMKRLDFY